MCRRQTPRGIPGTGRLPQCLFSPHVTLLPGDDMKHSGDQEEGTQAHAVHPGRDPFPAVVRQTVQQCHPHKGRHNE